MNSTTNECTQKVEILVTEGIKRIDKWWRLLLMGILIGVGIFIGFIGTHLTLRFVSGLNWLKGLILSAPNSCLHLFVLITVLIFIVVIMVAFARFALQYYKEINVEHNRIRENRRLIIEKGIESISSLDKTSRKCSPVVDISIRRMSRAGIDDDLITWMSCASARTDATSASATQQ